MFSHSLIQLILMYFYKQFQSVQDRISRLVNDLCDRAIREGKKGSSWVVPDWFTREKALDELFWDIDALVNQLQLSDTHKPSFVRSSATVYQISQRDNGQLEWAIREEAIKPVVPK